MTILLEQSTLPERGRVEINLQRVFEIQVTAAEAQHQVDGWLFDHVSYMMGAKSPTLVIGQQVVWRVPVILTASHVGVVGEVGMVDVDVQTGQFDHTPACIERLQKAGIELDKRLPPYQPGRILPDEYWAKDIQPTHLGPQRQLTATPELASTL